MTSENRAAFVVRLPQGLYKTFKHRCVDAETSMNAVIVGLVEGFVGDNGRAQPPTPPPASKPRTRPDPAPRQPRPEQTGDLG